MAIKNSFLCSFEKVWFLDAYGHVLCYEPYRRGLARVPLLGMLLKGFVALPYPLPVSSVPTWWGNSGVPLEVPALVLDTEDSGFVTLRNEAGAYLSIDVRNNHTLFVSVANEWERFLPITHDMFQGLILMTDPDIGEVHLSSTGQRIKQLEFPQADEKEFYTALLGTSRIDLMKSRQALVALGRLGVHDVITLSLPLYNSEACCEITATRLKPIVGEG